jgi:hypothetical protein
MEMGRCCLFPARSFLSAHLRWLTDTMPSFTNLSHLPASDHPSHSIWGLNSPSTQLTPTSIIGNWHLDVQSNSIPFCLDICGLALQQCNCPALSFPRSQQDSSLLQYPSVIAAMALAQVLFIPWPSWAKLSFVRGLWRTCHPLLCHLHTDFF